MPAPIDITSRPRTHQPKSNLTSQLRAAEGSGYPLDPIGGRSGSISQSNAISVSNKYRRESIVNGEMARSLMGGGGMSWGGVSVGSWIRDDIIMAGTSPFTFGSPSFHSSSYLPKLEADFCRDFSCCGLPLPSLHDLLRHYEEHHAQQTAMQPQHPRPQQQNASGMTSPISGMGGIQLGMMRQRLKVQQEIDGDMKEENEEQDGEVAGDMEMDDDDMTPPPAPLTPQNHNQHTSYPPTPTTHSQPSYQNTPNLAHAQPSGLGQKPSHFSPESSVPGTPHAMDQIEYGFPQQNSQGLPSQQNIPAYDYEMVTGNIDLCINEPAKTLFSPGGIAMGGYTTQYQHMISAGGNGNLLPQEDKPFKCPVIGCEKAYKNQNGLKYHKSHGHANQQLHDNSDGTFSILNPETSTPYPGTVGMEKQKPYRCEYCGKRYKNLNGLKYHRSHTTHGGLSQPAPQPGGVVAVAGVMGGENGMGMV